MEYICHLCGLKTKLNVLTSSHYRKHSDISKEQFKLDLLLFNGREPKHCKTCGKITHINKGEKDYNDYCNRYCYENSHYFSKSKLNPNWKGGKSKYQCSFCNKTFLKYSSSMEGDNKFCSVSCSTKYYYCIKNNISIEDYIPKAYEYDEKLLKVLSKQCLKEADYTCDVCGIRGSKLEAHHLDSKKYFKDKIYDINNLVCLCSNCHNKFHSVCGIGRDFPITKLHYLIFKSVRLNKVF